MKRVKFHLNDQPIQLRHRQILRQFIESIFKKEGRRVNNLNIIFCNDNELRSLNRNYLNHDYFTDVLTFDLSSSSTIDGEIYLSVPRIKQNASTYKILFSEELYRVMFHGILHLCGYTDNKTSSKLQMEEKQDHYIRSYNNLKKDLVSRGTIKKN